VFHDKSLQPSRSKVRLHRELTAAGFVVTSQDEEHGLLQDDYAAFAASRFSTETLGNVAGAFMWGPHDHEGLRKAFPAHEARILPTGSPRVDLWRPSAERFYATGLPSGTRRDRPLVVIVAYGYRALSVNRIWDEIENLRGTYIHGSDDPTEWGIHAEYVEEAHSLGLFVRAVRAAVVEHPNVSFIVRPHPTSADGAWESLLGAYPNLAVRRDGAVGPWVRGAALVIHDASTVGFEAAVAGVPLASFWATQAPPALRSSHLGARFTTSEELGAIVARVLDGDVPWYSEQDRQVLEQRFGDLSGRLAAERIVDAWEDAGAALESAAATVPTVRNIGAWAHRRAGRARNRLRGAQMSQPFQTGHKFRRFDRGEIRHLLERFRTGFDRFASIELRHHGPRLLSLKSKR
jgi:surface carbohydrate biosynthesis protein